MAYSVYGMVFGYLGRYILCLWWQSAEGKVRSKTWSWNRDSSSAILLVIFLPVCCQCLLPIIMLQLSLPAKIIICQTQTCLWHRLLRQVEWKYAFEKSCLNMYRKDFVQPHLGSWWVDWGCDWQQWLKASYFYTLSFAATTEIYLSISQMAIWYMLIQQCWIIEC